MKDIKTQEDLVWLIDNEVEESRILEFKSELPKKSLSERDNSKRILSKAVSALANTNGGQLIIGLIEVNDIASEINWIEEKNFRQTLDNWINSELDPVITNYEIKTIRNKQNNKQNIFVIKFEKSRKGPHQARDGAYYKRVETSSITMSDFEVKSAMFRSGLYDALILELRDNSQLIEDFLIKSHEIKDKYLERPPIDDHHLETQAIIFPFKTEAWKAITYSGLLSIVQQNSAQLIELYQSIYQVNQIIEVLKFGHRSIVTQQKKQSSYYIVAVIESMIQQEIKGKIENILKSFTEREQKI